MATSITAHCYPNPRTDTGLYSGVEGQDVAMLATGHWMPKKMPLHTVYPRPDTETQSHARHRNFHSSFRYEIPIGVQGGAWPFLYTLLVAPSGATIGEQLGDPNYGVISWTPTGQTGSQRFTVQVVDQDGDKITLSWTTVLNDAGFVFIQSSALISGTGTIESPLKTFDDWYKHNVNDATFLNLIPVFRGGTYSVVGDTSDGNVKFSLAAKTNSLIGHPDEIAVLDCSTAKFYNSVLLHDLYVSHLTFNNGRSDVQNSHFWWITSLPNRVVFFKNTFDGIGKGISGSDNPSCIFVSDAGEKVNYLIKHNTFKNVVNTQSNGSYFDWYDVKYGLVEQNVARDSIVDYGMWAKATIGFITFRGNIAVENVSGRQACIGYGSATSSVPNNHEVCYNIFCLPSSQTTLPIFECAMSNSWQATSFNTFVYRNSFVGGNTWLRFTQIESDANIVYTNNLARWQLDDQTTEIANDVRTTANDFVDISTGLLIGTGRSTHFGFKGGEID